MPKATPTGRPCFWCRRPMLERFGRHLKPTSREAGLLMSKDHLMLKSQGGRRCVRACRACNNVRGDMPVVMWKHFRKQVPGWWSLYESKGLRGRDLFYSLPGNESLRKWEDVLFPAKPQEAAE